MSSTRTSIASRAGPWPGMGKNRYSVVAYYTRDLVYERLGPGLLKELEDKSPKNGDGHRPSRFHQWLTEDVGGSSSRPALALTGDAAEARPCERARVASLPELGQSRASQAWRHARCASRNAGNPKRASDRIATYLPSFIALECSLVHAMPAERQSFLRRACPPLRALRDSSLGYG